MPFKTQDDLSDRLSTCSETIRVDYHRRFETASLAVLSAHRAKEQANLFDAQANKHQAEIKRGNMFAIAALVLIEVFTLAIDLPHGRLFSGLLGVLWVVCVGAMEIFLIPTLRLQQTIHWNGYQISAREWRLLIGNQGFAEHFAVTAAEYRGEAPEDADAVQLAVRGFALIQAERAIR